MRIKVSICFLFMLLGLSMFVLADQVPLIGRAPDKFNTWDLESFYYDSVQDKYICTKDIEFPNNGGMGSINVTPPLMYDPTNGTLSLDLYASSPLVYDPTNGTISLPAESIAVNQLSDVDTSVAAINQVIGLGYGNEWHPINVLRPGQAFNQVKVFPTVGSPVDLTPGFSTMFQVSGGSGIDVTVYQDSEEEPIQGYVMSLASEAHTLNSHSDVDTSASTIGQVLVKGYGGEWHPETISSGVTDHGALTGLSDDDHTQYHNDSRADTWLATKTVTYTPASMTVAIGTLDAGTVSDLAAVGGTLVNISEVSVDGIDVNVEFTGVTALNQVLIYGRYQGGANHDVEIQIYNVTEAGWEQLDFMGNSTVNRWYSHPIYNSSSYINSGAVLLKFKHIGVGVNTHDLYLDYVVIRNSLGSGGGVIDHGALTGLQQDDHPQYLLNDELNATSPILYDPTNGTISLGTVPIASGGTGQTTAQAAIDALLPSQTGNSGKVLGTNGTTASWVAGGGSGDMTKATYDADTDNVVDNAEGLSNTAATINVNASNGTNQLSSVDFQMNGVTRASVSMPNSTTTPVTIVTGSADTRPGLIQCGSNSTTVGGRLSLYNGGGEDTSVDYWDFEADGNSLLFKDGTSTVAKINWENSGAFEAQQFVLTPKATAGSSPGEGMLYYDSTAGDKRPYYYDGTAWRPMGLYNRTKQIFLTGAGAITSQTGGAAAQSKYEHGSNTYYYPTFQAATADTSVEWTAALPLDYNGSTTYKVIFTPTGAGTGSQGVRWLFQGTSMGNADALNATQGTAAGVTVTVNPFAGNTQYTSAATAFTIANAAAGELVQFKLTRDQDDAADTLDQSVGLLMVIIEYSSSGAN